MSGRLALRLSDLRDCLEGAIPAAIATASPDGTPNVTYLSKVNFVDHERVALSNQFFSKTARNLAENPKASVLLMHPSTCDQFRLTVVYERTDRRGEVFDRLRSDLDTVAALQGMHDVFKLRAADIYRVVEIEPVLAAVHHHGETEPHEPPVAPVDPERIAELTARLSRCQDLDTLVGTTLSTLADLFGYEYAHLLLLDEPGTRLYTIASRGYDAEGVGSEVYVGDGIIGLAAARCAPVRVGNVIQMAQYASVVRHAYEDIGLVEAGRTIPAPGLSHAKSRIAVPAMALGELVGVLTVESAEPIAFGTADEAILGAAASLVASAMEVLRTREIAEGAPDAGPAPEALATQAAGDPPAQVRFFAVDGSAFIDGDYLIRGVAGRILWSLLRSYDHDGRVEFTNRETRLDPSLDLPPYRDNFDGRLLLLKRRLDERNAPVRIDKTGRGRFRLVVHRPLRLDHVDP
jgi:adenylate cyclase